MATAGLSPAGRAVRTAPAGRLAALAGGAAGFGQFYGDEVAAGQSRLTPAQVARLKRRVDATDGGNMLVAVGFARKAAADRWGTGLVDVRPLATPVSA